MTDTEAVSVNVTMDDVKGNLMYCLLKDAIIVDNECIPVYGVSVAFVHSGGMEFEKIHNVTTAKREMQELIEKMKEGLVFPVSLKDIVEDFVA